MKYILPFAILFSMSASAQMKGDTTKPTLKDVFGNKHAYSDETDTILPKLSEIVFLMQQNKELSDRLDRAENKIDSLEKAMHLSGRLIDYEYNQVEDEKLLDRISKRVNYLDNLPYLFIDFKGVRPGVYLTNSKGEYQLFITPINYK